MYLIIDFITNAQCECTKYRIEYNYIKKAVTINPKITPTGYKQIYNVRKLKSSKGKFIKKYEDYNMLCCSDYTSSIQTAYHLFRNMKKKLYVIPYVKEYNINNYAFFRNYDESVIKELNNSNYNLKVSTDIIDKYKNNLNSSLSKFFDFLLNTLLNIESNHSLIKSATTKNDNFRIAIVTHKKYINNFIKCFPNYEKLFLKTPLCGDMSNNIYNLTTIKCCISKKELYKSNLGDYKFKTPLIHILSLKEKKYITKENKINRRNNLILITGIFIGASSIIYKLIKKNNNKN